MKHTIDIRETDKLRYTDLGAEFSGKSPDGRTVGVNNFFLELNGKPKFFICAEMHYSRTNESMWEDHIIKMKLGGVNIISSYLIWNHHEETEGVFDFTGNKNVRRFIELCAKHDMLVIVRLGAFCHGEVRNGGIPDWVYGKPFEPRTLSDGWLECSRKLYTEYAKQLSGLFYEEGGPIIAAQVDNEYMHSSAMWEITTGVSDEWIYGGGEGDEYMLRLRDLARDCGIKAVFFTCTGWGGAATPEGFLPLWGGYAYRPWLFYSHRGEHPLTNEYLYRNFHDNDASIEDFDPCYKPESMPYACCEMGGGMFCSYYYRFQLPFKSVDAMANIKTASACNFLGYYMFCGGTNPKTSSGGFLNESQAPKMSYDFQAPIGEFGQERESYRRLRTWHAFLDECGEQLCSMKTHLPVEADILRAEDVKNLRYAVRCEGKSGFLFLNNFQDHTDNEDLTDQSVSIRFPDETITIDGISIAPEENCALPFNMPLGSETLLFATAQPFTHLTCEGRTWSFFVSPDGMKPRYAFGSDTQIEVIPRMSGSVDAHIDEQGRRRVSCEAGRVCVFSICCGLKEHYIVTLPRAVADNACRVKICGSDILLISDGAVLADDNGVRLETTESSNLVRCFPANALERGGWRRLADEGIFGVYVCETKPVEIKPELEKVGFNRYNIMLPPDCMSGIKELMLNIDYVGDIGAAFIDGDMIHDNFYNGAPWELGIARFADRLQKHPLTINITPIRKGANVNVESTMAARLEEADELVGQLNAVTAVPVYEIKII